MLAKALRKRLSKKENQKGFTLIELLAVIVIMGIIAVIAIPMIGKIITNSKDDADLATARQIYDASRLYITAEKNGTFATVLITDNDATTEDLVQAGYLESPIYLPSTKEVISGGSVTFTSAGVLNGVTITTASHAGTDTSKAISFTSEQVLKSEKK